MKSKKTAAVQQPVASVREYFTDAINEQVNEMTLAEMADLLRNLPMSRVWLAIIKYNQERILYSQSILFSADPFKNPTDMARQQGVMLGLSDLQNAVIELNTEKEEDGEEDVE